MTSSHKSRSKLGTKREIRPNVWQIGVSCGTRADGKRRTAWRTVHGTDVDADAAIVKLADEMRRCASIGDDMTLDRYFWGYFSPFKHATTTNANAVAYDSCYRVHIAPAFGSWQIERIGNLEVQRWINGLPPQSAPNYVRTMRAIMNRAEFEHVIIDNPMRYRYTMPRGRSNTPLPVMGAYEVGLALERLKGTQLYALWLVMVGCGLSRSEALALDWDDIAWDEVLQMDGKRHWVATVHVKAAYTSADGMKEPKNDRRYRRVPMMPPFSDALRGAMGTGPICQSRLHTKDGWRLSGRRLRPDSVPKLWKAYFEPNGPLDGLTFVHIGRMRATYSTLMQRAGVDGSIINAMQGRTDNSPVLYTNYLMPGIETYAESARAMSALL